MAGQNQVHAMIFENGQERLPHLDQLHFHIRIVRALGVGWVVPKRDDPILHRAGQIGAQPIRHGTVCGAVGRH
jgi:hypothetical protein